MKIRFEPEAEQDVWDAARWYESEAPGLGYEFMRTVEAAVHRVARFPEAFAEVRTGLRRTGIKRFPYSLFYEIEPDRIVVIACMHQHRDPESWPNS